MIKGKGIFVFVLVFLWMTAAQAAKKISDQGRQEIEMEVKAVLDYALFGDYYTNVIPKQCAKAKVEFPQNYKETFARVNKNCHEQAQKLANAYRIDMPKVRKDWKKKHGMTYDKFSKNMYDTLLKQEDVPEKEFCQTLSDMPQNELDAYLSYEVRSPASASLLLGKEGKKILPYDEKGAVYSFLVNRAYFQTIATVCTKIDVPIDQDRIGDMFYQQNKSFAEYVNGLMKAGWITQESMEEDMKKVLGKDVKELTAQSYRDSVAANGGSEKAYCESITKDMEGGMMAAKFSLAHRDPETAKILMKMMKERPMP